MVRTAVFEENVKICDINKARRIVDFYFYLAVAICKAS